MRITPLTSTCDAFCGSNDPRTCCRRENNLRILRTLQNFLMHLLVAGIVVGIGAARVHHDRAAGLAGRRIKMNLPAFQLESSVHGVQRGIERECNLRLRGIEVDDIGLRTEAGAASQRNVTRERENNESSQRSCRNIRCRSAGAPHFPA